MKFSKFVKENKELLSTLFWWITLIGMLILLSSCNKDTDLIGDYPKVKPQKITFQYHLPHTACYVVRSGYDLDRDGALSRNEITEERVQCRDGNFDYVDKSRDVPGTDCEIIDGGIDFNQNRVLDKIETYPILTYIKCN